MFRKSALFAFAAIVGTVLAYQAFQFAHPHQPAAMPPPSTNNRYCATATFTRQHSATGSDCRDALRDAYTGCFTTREETKAGARFARSTNRVPASCATE